MRRLTGCGSPQCPRSRGPPVRDKDLAPPLPSLRRGLFCLRWTRYWQQVNNRPPEETRIMLTDRYGLAISTSSETAREAYIAGCDGVMAAWPGDKAHLMRAVE